MTRCIEALACGEARGLAGARSAAREREGSCRRKCQASPVEERARIGLAPGRDVAVPADRGDGVRATENFERAVECQVLGVGERFEVRAFEFDPYREVVAARPTPKLRGPGMPG